LETPRRNQGQKKRRRRAADKKTNNYDNHTPAGDLSRGHVQLCHRVFTSMTTNQPRNEDEPLRALLKEWKAASSLPPGFQEQVWRRIERAEAQPISSVPLWTAWTNWIAAVLPRPALATAYVAVFLAIGATVGWAQARHETERVSGDLSTRYVRLVDPYQAPR
jgi:hypothetical protein